MAEYKNIIIRNGRGNLLFDKVYLKKSKNTFISLHGLCIRPYITYIKLNSDGHLKINFSVSFLEKLYIDSNCFLCWEKSYRTNQKFWVCVKLPTGEKRWYQLPKDLQIAMWQHYFTHPNNWNSVLLGAFINVPLRKYYKGHTELTCGEILTIKIRGNKKVPSHHITRSQFIQPKNTRLGFKYLTKNDYSFMRHNFSQRNRENISRHLHIAILHKNFVTFYSLFFKAISRLKRSIWHVKGTKKIAKSSSIR